jgi:uncharacterized protein
VHHLGDDAHGTWLWGPSGRTIRRGEEPLFTTEQDALVLIVDDAWWSPSWWVGHPEISVYVNIGTPPVRHGELITSTDLDLDVIRFRDGRVEIVDQDEFDLHQRELGYPAEVIESTERAAEAALALVRAGTPPFDDATAQRWIDRARAADLPSVGEAPSA